METRAHETTYSIEEFERRAQELVHIMLALCEERIHAAPRLESPIGNTMAEAAMSVKYALQAFIAIERLRQNRGRFILSLQFFNPRVFRQQLHLLDSRPVKPLQAFRLRESFVNQKRVHAFQV